ncbi:hypothetical protein [Roseibium sediminicola]|uniref:Uncharacterized protein n=1 Tax=Roseibium sediminicola TaxID=2933272 RepID=A0ABT0GZ54_9HYPH|nr:hypothetical protein [Roseibium sp. CAU 1639]MCK7614724.1 hypothetical protein [Roseibium sp. CAU 1639]
MGWSEYTYPGGAVWKINYGNVANVIRAYAYMVALSENVRIDVVSSYPGFSMDEIRMRQSNTLHHDKDIVDNRAKDITQKMYQAFLAMLTTSDHRDAENFLAGLRTKTMRLRREHGGLVEQSNAMNRSFLARATQAVELAKATRDGSILILSVIASVASGGTAVAAATLATGGTAVAKYQDTNDAGEAVKAGAGCLILLGWGQLANFTKGMQATDKAIFFTLGVSVDFSVNVTMNASEKQLGEAAETAAWTTLRNAGFFWLDLGTQKLLSREVGLMAQKNSQELLRCLYQGTGRLTEKAILEDLAKKPQGKDRPNPLSHEAREVSRFTSAEAFNYVRTNCMYRAR